MSTIKETNTTTEKQETLELELNAVTRKIYFALVNATGQDFYLSGEHFVRGHFEGEKPSTIVKCSQKKFTVVNKGDRGLEGTLIWKGKDTGGDFSLNFNKPAGSGDTTISPTAPAGYGCCWSGNPKGHESWIAVAYWKML
ncbi:MAG: hypothetical protein FWG55_00140 [Candidatus Bathyarchaeota archaeon]|nr:hypothetical protein [Candidatus Termiticorpusculum sp.]